MQQFRKNGNHLINSTKSLWDILKGILEDPKAGFLILVLDALDECDELELTGFIRRLESQFRSHHPSKLKLLLTCRPYKQIISKFHGLLNNFPNIHIPGEEESEAISQEVDSIITHRINQLPLSPEIKNYLEEKLRETPHRTYLWVYLIFDYIQQGDFKQTLKGAESFFQMLPRNVNEVYEQILNKSREEQEPIVRKTLSIILAASRPLTLSEMNIAMSIDDTAQDGTTDTLYNLDLEDERNFKLRPRSWCGLFISIYQGRVYLLHQTAREFLLADSISPTLSGRQWHHSITIRQAHNVVAKLCILYLNMLEPPVIPPTGNNREVIHLNSVIPFLEYAIKYWALHFREAHIIDGDAIIPATLNICNPSSKSFSIWFKIYQEDYESLECPKTYENPTDLIIASFFGLYAIVKLYLEKAANIEVKDDIDRTPLFWAALEGHEEVVELLINNGANIRARDFSSHTPLSLAARYSKEATVKVLIDKGADTEVRGSDAGQTPLLEAAIHGHEAIMKLLIEKGAYIEARNRNGQTPLLTAVSVGDERLVKLLIESGADIEAKNNDGQTPLLIAIRRGNERIGQLLLGKGAVFPDGY